jgi:hypothetical protein
MRMTFQSLTFLLLSLALLAGRVHAVTVNGLYDAVVAVPDTSEAERSPALSRALEKVLVRASGSPRVLQREGIRDVLANAGSLVQAYRYQRAPGEGDAEGELQLAVSFGAVGVTRALAGIGAPVWGANRPAVLAWVAVQSRSGRTLATASADSEWGAIMERAAQDKGIPLVLPEYDEVDRAVLGLSDIWGLFMAPIERASERYRSDLLGVARISETNGGYVARWALRGGGVGLDGEVRGESPAAVADAITAAWAEALAERYAVAPGADQTLQVVDVVISAVRNLEAYAEIRQSLAAMEPVSGAAPVRVVGDTLRIRLAFNGELELLREHLALERRLVSRQATDQEAPGPDNWPQPDGAPHTAAPVPEMTSGGQSADEGTSSLDPTIQPIPAPGEPVTAVGDAIPRLTDKEEEDFKSLYPVLYFKWTGSDDRGQPSGRLLSGSASE